MLASVHLAVAAACHETGRPYRRLILSLAGAGVVGTVVAASSAPLFLRPPAAPPNLYDGAAR